jgi:hypothetical protein
VIGTGYLLALGPSSNISGGGRFLGFLCLAYLLGTLYTECRSYANPRKTIKLPEWLTLRWMVLFDLLLLLLKIGAVWYLSLISSFGDRTILAIVLTAVNVIYCAVDIRRMHKNGVSPVRRSKVRGRFWIVNNSIEALLVLLLAFG